MPTVDEIVDTINGYRNQLQQAKQIIDAQNKKIQELETNKNKKDPKKD